MNYQFIVICGCKNRKDIMTELFKQLNIPDNLIYYLEASTPENSEKYFIDFPNIENTKKKVICCAKSHFRAIEYAGKCESPEYSIIIEDDAAFHKTYFLKVVEEIISNWKHNFNNCHYISLGWVPCNNYDFYELKQKMTIESITNIDDNICFLNDFYNVGAQCYIVKKDELNNISLLLNQKTYKEYKALFSHDEVDYLLPRMMNYKIIFPPLVIEQDVISMLGHNNKTNYWSKFFNGHEEKIKNYVTY